MGQGFEVSQLFDTWGFHGEEALKFLWAEFFLCPSQEGHQHSIALDGDIPAAQPAALAVVP